MAEEKIKFDSKKYNKYHQEITVLQEKIYAYKLLLSANNEAKFIQDEFANLLNTLNSKNKVLNSHLLPQSQLTNYLQSELKK